MRQRTEAEIKADLASTRSKGRRYILQDELQKAVVRRLKAEVKTHMRRECEARWPEVRI